MCIFCLYICIVENKILSSSLRRCVCEQDGKCRYRTSTVGATDTGLVNIPYGDERKLMVAVAMVGPVSVAIDASQSSFRFYDTGE